MAPTPGPDIQKLLSGYDPGIQELALEIRALILRCVPAAAEKANPGWRSISFRHPDVGYFCGIFPQAEWVDLLFEFGVLLPDREGLLAGEAAQVRYIRLGREDELPATSLEKLIEAALQLPGDRATRMQMVKSGARLTDLGEEGHAEGS